MSETNGNGAMVKAEPPKAPIHFREKQLMPDSIEGVFRLADMAFMSGMLPESVKNKVEAAMLIAAGLEAGLGFVASVQNVMIVNRRPCIWGDSAVALAYNTGLVERLSCEFSGDGDQFGCTCTIQRKGVEGAFVQRFTIADAKLAGLWGKGGPWKAYPKRMLQNRARAYALRDAFADALRGLSIREEVDDFEVTESATRVRAVQERVNAASHNGHAPALPEASPEAQQASEETTEALFDPDAPLTAAAIDAALGGSGEGK